MASETQALGRVLRDDGIWPRVAGDMATAGFADVRNALVFAAMARVHASGKSIDLITTMQQLEADGTLAQAGGAAYLAGLADVGL